TTCFGLSGGRGGSHIGANQFNSNRSTNAGRARVTDVVTMSTRMNANSDGLNDHPAPYPWQLAEWCGKLIIPDGGTILDPFSGSASTGVAALRNGWNYIGIDSSEEYVSMSARRLEAAQTDGKETEGEAAPRTAVRAPRPWLLRPPQDRGPVLRRHRRAPRNAGLLPPLPHGRGHPDACSNALRIACSRRVGIERSREPVHHPMR